MSDLTTMGLVPWIYPKESQGPSSWFEVDGNEWRLWARSQLPICLGICVVYLIFVFLAPIFMATRKAYDLQRPLIIWNFLLAIFSIAGASRMLPPFFETLSKPNGFHQSACTTNQWDYSSSFWGLAFTLSKVAELIDTVFIVLRKKPLIFLHWAVDRFNIFICPCLSTFHMLIHYTSTHLGVCFLVRYHHLSMVWVTFYLFSEGEPVSRWGAVLNYSIHSVMYSYYTLKAMNIKVSRKISMAVTSLQILQFVTGFIVHLYTQWILVNGGECFRTSKSLKIYYVLGISYLGLFLKLFYKSYIAKPKSKLS